MSKEEQRVVLSISVPLRGLLALTACGLAACGPAQEGERAIEVSRVVDVVGDSAPWGGTSAERFGLRSPSLAPRAGSDASSAGAGELTWSTPPGWREVPLGPMRVADFRVGDPPAECYLTLLPGDGGGIAANIQRWRKQMSLPPASEEELLGFPRAELFGRDAVLVDFEGTWVGMGGDELVEGQRLVGLLSVADGEARFLKFIGPAEVVSAERGAFLALGRSFQYGATAANPHAGAGTPLAGGGSRGESMGAAMTGGLEDPSSGAMPSPALQRAAGLAWQTPEGWVRGTDRPFRVVTFSPDGEGAVECYVTLLNGDGGGVEPNVSRWVGQLDGGVPGTGREVQREELEFLEGDGLVVEIAGAYEGRDGIAVADARMMGAIRMLPGRAVFVKMLGPRDLVEEARESFLEFCRSLEEES